MNILLDDICAYLDFLIGKLGYFVTLHGSPIVIPELAKYNFHLNPYCRYIKTVCNNWNICVEKQKKVFEKVKDGEFVGVCHAGVGEYVYPIGSGDSSLGFISVSGYAGRDEKQAVEKAVHFAEKNGFEVKTLLKMRADSLLSEQPENAALDAVIHPLIIMLEGYFEKGPSQTCDSRSLYTDLLQYITENHCSELSVKMLGQKFNYSVSTISHLFKKNSGMSINQYIEKLRLDEAKWLLKHSELSIIEISDSLGFCNPAYFSYVFKKNFGVSPRNY